MSNYQLFIIFATEFGNQAIQSSCDARESGVNPGLYLQL